MYLNRDLYRYLSVIAILPSILVVIFILSSVFSFEFSIHSSLHVFFLIVGAVIFTIELIGIIQLFKSKFSGLIWLSILPLFFLIFAFGISPNHIAEIYTYCIFRLLLLWLPILLKRRRIFFR